MSWAATLAVSALLIVLSALFSGSETAMYTFSRLRLDADAQEGRRLAKLVRVLVRNEAALLVTILIGNNLMIELLTRRGEHELERWAWLPAGARELVLAALLTPVVFFFAELLPKDLFHRRPNALLSAAAPFLFASRVVFAPLAVPLRGLSVLLERAFSMEERSLARALGREAVIELLDEGARWGALTPHAQRLALNALELRAKRISSVLVPWAQVAYLSAGADEAERLARVRSSRHTRLPVVDGEGRVDSYVHQLDVLGDGGQRPVLELARPLLKLSEDLPVDRALARLRIGGHRMALVGPPEAPTGIVTLKDLVETISGDLAEW